MRKFFAFAFAVLFVIPLFAAERDTATSARVGAVRNSQAAARAPNLVTSMKTTPGATVPVTPQPATSTTTTAATAATPPQSTGCRQDYRDCMDQFCLLSEDEGYRCVCSDDIENSKPIIKDVMDLNDQADKAFNEDVERENYGVKAKLIFTKKDTGPDFTAWMNSGATDELGQDQDMGSNLYAMASEQCESKLDSCPDDKDMEILLYSRQITADCKTYAVLLQQKKTNAQQYLASGQAAVRTARASHLNETNLYNRGECLLAFRSCVQFKGECGQNFENCLDTNLLIRRGYACEDILDQCDAVRTDVQADWKKEIPDIIANAQAHQADFQRQNCFAKIDECLETNCGTATRADCLTSIQIASGICPVITECDKIAPGIKASTEKNRLTYFANQFCKTDLTNCFKDKCGENFTNEICTGQTIDAVSNLCLQKDLPFCKKYGKTEFQALVTMAMVQVKDAQMMVCINYIDDFLQRSGCGTDMSCIPVDASISALTDLPADQQAFIKTLNANTEKAVADFFDQIATDSIKINACKDAYKDKGSIFGEAKALGTIAAKQRMQNAFDAKTDEISRGKSLEDARTNCDNILANAKAQNPKDGNGKELTRDDAIKKGTEGNWTTDAVFEPDLRNCKLTQFSVVCEKSGVTTASAVGKNIAGGLAAGAGIGSGFGGLGAAIGAGVGAIGGLGLGFAQGAAAKKPECHEVGPIYVDRNI